jgi:type I restriction enzyme S subunit
MTSLPSGWVRVRLDEVAEVRLGRQRSPKNHSGTHMRPYLRAANVGWNGLILDDVKEMNFTDEEARIYGLAPGDIILSEASGSPEHVGKPALWSGEIEDCCFQNTLIRVRSLGPDPRFLLYLLRYESLRGAFVGKSRGVGIHHLGSQRLAGWPVTIPPLAAQRQIVAALESHLLLLDSSTAAIRSSLRRAERLRIRFLVDSVMDTGKTWDRYVLGQVAESVRNGLYISRPSTEPDGVPILRIGSVRSLRLHYADIRHSGKGAQEIERGDYLIRPGDLLFTRYNGNPDYVGVCACVPDGIGLLTYPDKLIRVRVNRSYVLPDYLAMVCSVGESREAIRRCAKTTAGQAGISGRELKSIPIRLPELAEQKRRVAEFAERDEWIEGLKSALEDSSLRASALRKSILREAFSGRVAE